MSQHDYIINSDNGANVRLDINNALMATITNNSGTSAPSTTYAYMLWVDTANAKLKLRNSSNSDWIILFDLGISYPSFPVDTQIFVYQNVAPTGWTYESGITDKVLAVKGGSQSFNVNGGSTAGTWAVTGITVDSHTHTVSAHVHTTSHYHTIIHTHDIPIASYTNALYTIPTAVGSSRTFTHHNGLGQSDEADVAKNALVTYGTNTANSGVDTTNTGNPTTNPASGTASSSATTSAETWRPAAAVGIICSKD